MRYGLINAGELLSAGTKLESNLSYTGYTGGLSIQYTVECDTDQFICSLKSRLAYSVMLRAGVLILQDVIYGTTRVNSVTTIDREKAEALKEDYELQYSEAIQNALHNVRFPNDICFRCDQRIKVISRIP